VGTLGGGSPADAMFIDAVSKYAPVAPLGGGAMVMLHPTTILWISSSGAPLAGVAPVRGYSSRRSFNGAPVGRLVHLRVETWWITGQPNDTTNESTQAPVEGPPKRRIRQPRSQTRVNRVRVNRVRVNRVRVNRVNRVRVNFRVNPE
jgi:hypothetical protein